MGGHRLGAGADDYLAKPAALDELVARIEANLRWQRIWVDPSLPDQRDLVRNALGLAVEIAPMVEHMLARAQPLTDMVDLARTLESVIERVAFHPVFQPIRDITTGRIVGYEALTRFDDGTPPAVRFEEALITGLGPQLELATLRAALHTSSSLATSRYLSVNLSATLLGHAGLPEILDIASDRQLAIEITEHEQIDDYERVRHLARLTSLS